MLAIITQRQIILDKLGSISGIENNYIDFFENKNFNLIIVPNSTKNIKYFLNKLPITHIILSGGNDISPEFYGVKSICLKDCSIKRDVLEKSILNFAVKKRIPVLGICRGMQFINVFFGGKLTQNIAEESNQNKCLLHTNTHFIKLVNKNLSTVLQADRFKINSYHNQGITINNLAGSLQVFALSEDDKIIEGLFHKNYPIIGVQWHPERDCAPKKLDNILIKNFINNTLFWQKQ